MGRTAMQGRPASPSGAPRRAAGQSVAALVNEALAPAPTVALQQVPGAWNRRPCRSSADRWDGLAAVVTTAVPVL
jgi:hypothetical protein